MRDIQLVFGGEELFDAVEPLWNELNRHHANVCADFAQWFCERDFTRRKADLLRRDPAALWVALALFRQSPVGYCMASLMRDRSGEVDSLYVRPDRRGQGLGGRLLQSALGWLHERQAGPVGLHVVAGNDRALRWYRRFGFAPRIVSMLRVENLDAWPSPGGPSRR